MHAFHIHYRNTQGTLMRILTAVSRRGLDMNYVHAGPVGSGHRADLLLEVNAKQIGQLCRDWHAIVDVTDVRVSVPTPKHLDEVLKKEVSGFAGADGEILLHSVAIAPPKGGFAMMTSTRSFS